MYRKIKIHFVGIGGVGMSGIAEVLNNLKYPVTGSDLKSTAVTRRLKKKGMVIYYGHKRENIKDVEVVVMSSAIKPNNPEIVEAKRRQIPIIQRAEMLAELMRFSKFGVAVAGSHGKTTTTSLIASILYKGGSDPTMIIGGRVNSFRSNARLGSGEFMVAEADESDGSFLKLSPTLVVVTSIDREHMDYYQTFDNLKDAYLKFCSKVPFYGAVVGCIDHPEVHKILKGLDKRVISYGLSEEAQFRAMELSFENGGSHFNLLINGEAKGRVTVNLLGAHNVVNALAALAIGTELGLSLPRMVKTLAGFQGIHRRLEVLLKTPIVTVLDDYGHHPEEIRVTLAAIRNSLAGRLVVFFQPHRYSRTQDLFKEFTQCFKGADVLLITDIYPAGEAPIPGVTAEKLIRELKDQPEVHYLPRKKNIVDEVVARIRPGDILLSLGAGDITKLGRDCARKLKGNAP